MDNLFDHIRPVILGKFGPATLACIRSWGMKGMNVGFVSIQSHNSFLPKSRYLKSYVIITPNELFTEAGMGKIIDYLIKFDATGITCINEDQALWIQSQRSIIPTNISIWLPRSNSIRTILPKAQQIHVAKKVGLKTLPTYLITKDLDSYLNIPLEDFPLCLRPNNADTVSPYFKVQLVKSPDELSRFIKDLYNIDEPLVAQRFLNLPNLVVHGTRSVDGYVSNMQAFLVDRKFSGLTLTIKSIAVCSDLIEKCANYVEKFAITGSYHFEFLYDPHNETSVFLELNGRFGGTTAKVFACGYDEPTLSLSSYLGFSFPKKNLSKRTCANRQALIKYMYYTLFDKITPLDYPAESRFRSLLSSLWLFIICKDEVLLSKDLRGSFAVYINNSLRFLRLVNMHSFLKR